MENQHRKITGYRELTQDDIDLMNEIKAEGQRLDALIQKVASQDRVALGEHTCWSAIARTQLQQGLMALTRAVAKPDFF
jgi:hypothetical protein